MKHLFNLNQLFMDWRGERKAQNAGRMQGWDGAERVMMQEGASNQHPISIQSASDGSSRRPA